MRALQLRRARDGGPEKRAQRASHCGRWTGRCRRWRAWTEQARAPGFAAPLAPARTASAGPKKNGGEGGIRTPGALLDTLVFETSPFGRSGTSPPDLARSLPPARSNAVDLQAIRVEAICSAPGQRNRSAKPVGDANTRYEPPMSPTCGSGGGARVRSAGLRKNPAKKPAGGPRSLEAAAPRGNRGEQFPGSRVSEGQRGPRPHRKPMASGSHAGELAGRPTRRPDGRPKARSRAGPTARAQPRSPLLGYSGPLVPPARQPASGRPESGLGTAFGPEEAEQQGSGFFGQEAFPPGDAVIGAG